MPYATPATTPLLHAAGQGDQVSSSCIQGITYVISIPGLLCLPATFRRASPGCILRCAASRACDVCRGGIFQHRRSDNAVRGDSLRLGI